MRQAQRHTFAAWAVVTCTIFLAACGGGSASLSPTGPSSSSASGSTTISGQVMGTGLTQDSAGVAATSAGAWKTEASTSLTVTVNGTTISSTVDASGRFALSNVPAGTVRLDFGGNGVKASVVISGVTAGDHIDVVVMLNGSTAQLQTQTVETEGTVQGLSGACPSIAFALNGRTVRANGSTRFDGTCSSLQNGGKVEVQGTRQSDGSLLATKVEVENGGGDDNEDRNELKGIVSSLTGGCPNLTFTLASQTILTNSSTRFDGGCSAVRNGRRIEVKGTTPVGGGLLAQAVEIDD